LAPAGAGPLQLHRKDRVPLIGQGAGSYPLPGQAYSAGDPAERVPMKVAGE